MSFAYRTALPDGRPTFSRLERWLARWLGSNFEVHRRVVGGRWQEFFAVGSGDTPITSRWVQVDEKGRPLDTRQLMPGPVPYTDEKPEIWP